MATQTTLTASPSNRYSSTFIFLGGSEAKQYPIYAPRLAPLSPTLGAMVNTTFSGTPCTFLPDCDTATSERFVEFVHHGDFASPLFVPVTKPGRPQRYKTKFLPPTPWHESPSVSRAFDAFTRNPIYTFPQHSLLYDNGWEENIDDTEMLVLSSVAKVYLLADRFGVEALKNLCLHKLHRLVVCVREIWDGLLFLRLCLARDSPKQLYKLAFKYCFFHYSDLKVRPEFASFVQLAPDFAITVMDELADHMAADAGVLP